MVITLERPSQTQYSNTKIESSIPVIDEIVAFCPGCKALETLWFNNGRLIPTRKYYPLGEQVFHDCGTSEPCRFYRL